MKELGEAIATVLLFTFLWAAVTTDIPIKAALATEAWLDGNAPNPPTQAP